MNDFTAFQDNFRALMDARGYSREEIAKGCGFQKITVSRYRNASEYAPSLKHVIAIAKFFNVSLEWLLGISQKQSGGAQELVDLYSLATPDDRHVVDSVLKKDQEVLNNDLRGADE